MIEDTIIVKIKCKILEQTKTTDFLKNFELCIIR